MKLGRVSLHFCAFALVCMPQAFATDAVHEDALAHGVEAAAHGAAEHAKSAGLPQFDPSSFPSQIFWLTAAFVILYLFFSKKTLPDISSVLENRRQHIQSDLDTAESLRKQAEEIHQAYEKVMEQAQIAASDYYLDAERTIKEKTQREMNAFYERAVEQVGETEKRIEAAKAEAMEDMSTIAAQIAAEVAQKIIGVSTDISQAKTVVQSIHKRKAA